MRQTQGAPGFGKTASIIQPGEIEAQIAKDLGVDKVVIVGRKNGRNSDPIVTYENVFKGNNYRSIRSVYLDDRGKWNPGKGLAFDADNTNDVFKAIGALVV